MTLLEKLGITPGPWEHESTDKTENKLDELIKHKDNWVGWAYGCSYARLMAQAPAMLIAHVDNARRAETIIGCLKKGDMDSIYYFAMQILGGSAVQVQNVTNKTWEEIKEMMEDTNE